MGPLNPVFHGTILTFFPLNKNIYKANKAPIINTPPIGGPNIRRIFFFLDGDCWTGDGESEGESEDSARETAEVSLLADSAALRAVKDCSCLFMVPFFEYLK